MRDAPLAPKTVIDADRAFGGTPSFRNCTVPFSFFYDETNNAGRVVLSKKGFPAEADRTFVLGGVALMPGKRIEHINDLRACLKVQSNAPELKFRHVAHGTYEDILSSTRLASFLSWLKEAEAFVHYSYLNILHWALVDIVDSLGRCNPLVEHLHHHLKAELSRVVSGSKAEFMQLLSAFDYPDVARERVGEFLEEVGAFVERHTFDGDEGIGALLQKVLSEAQDGEELVFLHDNDQGVLLDNFALVYANRIQTFRTASHTFDAEASVEQFFRTHELRGGSSKLNYRFVDSRQEVAVQVADVVAGLFGKHFDFVHNSDIEALRSVKTRMTQVQRQNLNSIRELVDRADAVSEALLHGVAPVYTSFKNNFFLFDLNPPSDAHGL